MDPVVFCVACLTVFVKCLVNQFAICLGVVALLMLFLCVILHTIWSGKSMQLLCILPFGMLCLSAIRMMFVKIILAMCMLVGIVV